MKRLIHSFTVRKIMELLLTLLIVTFLSFLLVKLSPVDAAEAYARRTFMLYTPDQLDALREKMGLNQPLLVQYGTWIRNALHAVTAIPPIAYLIIFISTWGNSVCPSRTTFFPRHSATVVSCKRRRSTRILGTGSKASAAQLLSLRSCLSVMPCALRDGYSVKR